MVIPSAIASHPNSNPLSPGGRCSAPGSKPPSGGTGYSGADTFQAGANGNVKQQLQVLAQQFGAIGQTVQQLKVDFGVGAAGPGGATGLGNVKGDPRLLQAMQQIARDPEGAKVTRAAQAPGLKVQVGQLPPGVMGATQNGTITLSPQALSNKPDLIHTLGHELGHAATPKDGDSIAEEQAVDQLGKRIQQRIAPGPTFQLNMGTYQEQGLPRDNGIRNSLAQIGL
jgi:hypothetical protein